MSGLTRSDAEEFAGQLKTSMAQSAPILSDIIERANALGSEAQDALEYCETTKDRSEELLELIASGEADDDTIKEEYGVLCEALYSGYVGHLALMKVTLDSTKESFGAIGQQLRTVAAETSTPMHELFQ